MSQASGHSVSAMVGTSHDVTIDNPVEQALQETGHIRGERCHGSRCGVNIHGAEYSFQCGSRSFIRCGECHHPWCCFDGNGEKCVCQCEMEGPEMSTPSDTTTDSHDLEDDEPSEIIEELELGGDVCEIKL